MKYFILILAIFLLIPFASANNSTIPIFADYKVNNLYTLSNAKLNIINPQGSVLLYNQSMNEMSKGRFNYTYSCNETGVYSVTAIFYNKTTAKELGSSTKDFSCGNPNALNILSCPTTSTGIMGMWIFLALLIIVGIAGAVLSIPALALISGGILFFYSIMTWSCGELITYFSIGLGLIFIGIGINIRK
jgi:hypothetical protein